MTEKLTTILITGPPGVGKTTLVKKVCAELAQRHTCRGFFTEEVRTNGHGPRIGFDVETLEGKRSILAREAPPDGVRCPKVGKYSVYVNDFEAVTLPLLARVAGSEPALLVIDEIGKMELISKRFESAVQALIGQTSLLATVPYQTRQPIPLVDKLKKASYAKVFEITKANRNQMPKIILEHIDQMLATEKQ